MPEIDRLKDIETEELSLVDRGANLKPRFLIVKREDSNMTYEEILKALVDAPDGPAVPEGWDGIASELEKAELDEAARGKVKMALRLLLSEDVSKNISASVKASLANALGIESVDDLKKKDDTPPADPAPEPKKAADPEPKTGDEPLSKMDKEAVERFEALEKRIADGEKEKDELKKDLGEQKALRRKGELVALAKQNFQHIPGKSADEIADILLKAEELGNFDEVLDIYKSVEGPLAKSLEVIGSDRGDDGSTAMGKVEKLAEAARIADPKLTEAGAISKVLEDNPSLYTAYIEEAN